MGRQEEVGREGYKGRRTRRNGDGEQHSQNRKCSHRESNIMSLVFAAGSEGPEKLPRTEEEDGMTTGNL